MAQSERKALEEHELLKEGPFRAPERMHPKPKVAVPSGWEVRGCQKIWIFREKSQKSPTEQTPLHLAQSPLKSLAGPEVSLDEQDSRKPRRKCSPDSGESRVSSWCWEDRFGVTSIR